MQMLECWNCMWGPGVALSVYDRSWKYTILKLKENDHFEKSIQSYDWKYTIVSFKTYDHQTESIRSSYTHCNNDRRVSMLWTSECLKIVYFRIKDRIFVANDRILFANDRLLSVMIVYFSKIVYFTWSYT